MKAKVKEKLKMKKKLMVLLMLVVLSVSVLAGCGAKGEEVNTVTGTFMEKKDFMFTVQDERGHYFGFNFDVKPENYEDFENGDIVKVTYTGTITEVDPFEGEILSIEKIK
jgi:predicted small lipoprotein YifL